MEFKTRLASCAPASAFEHDASAFRICPVLFCTLQSAQFCLSGSEQNAITTDSQPSIQPDTCRWPIGFRPDCVLFGLTPI